MGENNSKRSNRQRINLKIIQEDHKTTQDIGIALGCPQEVDCKDLLRKTLHASVAGHKEINLALKRMLPPW